MLYFLTDYFICCNISYFYQSDNNIWGQLLKFPAVSAFFSSNNDEEREKSIEKIWEHLRVVENQCFGDQKKFFGGDIINIVEIDFGSIFKFLVAEDILKRRSWKMRNSLTCTHGIIISRMFQLLKKTSQTMRKWWLLLSLLEKNVWHLPKKVIYIRSSMNESLCICLNRFFMRVC